MQNPKGSNFHIFDEMFHQLPSNLKSKLHLDSLPTFACLNSNIESPSLASHSFSNMDTALSTFGISVESRELMYKCIAAILHLEKIQFYESHDYVYDISESSRIFLDNAADLLNIDADQLKNAIILHHMSATHEV